MTRKHFEAIAKTIREEVDYWQNNPATYATKCALGALRQVVAGLAGDFARFNNAFDPIEFTSACGF